MGDEEEEDGQDESSSSPVRRLQHQTQHYLLLTQQIDRLGPDHPFLQTQRARLHVVRNSLLRDMLSALRQARATKDADAILALVEMYADLGAEREGVRVLKGAG